MRLEIKDKLDIIKHQQPRRYASSIMIVDHFDLKGMALITTWWYKAASAAPMNGPTQKIHCITREEEDHDYHRNSILSKIWL